jgi:hypothetical protein
MPVIKITYLIVYLNSGQYKNISFNQEINICSNVDQNGNSTSRRIVKYADPTNKCLLTFAIAVTTLVPRSLVAGGRPTHS